jgi:flavodoxin
MEKRYQMSVFDKTTAELYKQLRESDIDRKVVMEIKELFDDCDLVKFAKYVPLDRDIENDWQNAYMVVEKTKRIVVIPEQAQTEGVTT